jgi:serine/threonine protein kinase
MRLLTKDLGQRISAAGALAHPFLRCTREIDANEEK